jgi:hypothetical protein
LLLTLRTKRPQVVLKSEKAFERIKFEEDDIEGLFMRDILREEIKADDSRLQ